MLKLNLSILQKMLLGIFVVLLSVFIAFFLNCHRTKIQAKRNVLKDVATIADSYKAAVCQFLEIANHRARDFSSDGFVRTQLSRLLQGRKSSVDTLSKYLIENKIALDKSIKTIHILSTEGRIVASTDRFEIGKDVSQETFFLKGKNSLTVMESALGYERQPAIIIATPIAGLNKKITIGVLVNFIQLSRLNNILAGECLMEQRTALNKKERWRNIGVYLVNKNKLMIASSGFAKDDALKRTIETLPVLTSMTSNKELSGFYRDYRGIMVAGASAYIPSLEWLLLAEIDEGEALSLLPVLPVSASAPFFVILIVVILLMLVFYKNTILPICILTDNIKSISLGNYHIVTPVLSNDEVGRLCESFNGMAKEIQVKTELLEKSRHCLAEAQRIAHIGSWEWDIVNNKIYWSDEVYHIFGLSPHTFDGTYESVLECIHPDDKEFVKASVDNALYEKKPYDLQYRILLKDTTVRFIQAMVDVICDETTGRVIRMAGTVQDITAHKGAEEALAERTCITTLNADIGFALVQGSTLRDMLQLCANAFVKNLDVSFARIWIHRRETSMLELQGSAGMYTHIDGQHSRIPVGKFKIGRIAKNRKPHMTNAVIGDPEVHDQEWARQTGMVAFAGYPLAIEDRLLGVVAMFSRKPLPEITMSALSSVSGIIALGIEHKLMEEDIQQTKKRLEFILRVSPTMIYSARCNDFTTTFISENVHAQLGYDAQQFVHHQEFWYERVHPEDLPHLISELSHLAQVDHLALEYRFLHKDGTYRFMYDELNLIRDKEGNPLEIIGFWIDATERKKSEDEQKSLKEQLYHVQRMESIGTLAGGIAHDFNNILAIITGYGNLLEKRLEEDASSRSYVHKILKSAERATNLVQALLAFSRKQPSNPKPVQLDHILTQTKDLLTRIIGEDIVINFVPMDKDCVVMADVGQIEQVLVNLSTNARDAMPGGGRLTIHTNIVELGGKFKKVHGYGERGLYALISFSDTGVGIDEKIQKRIFEPFFTTKEVGKGTGLGLSIVYGIVKQHKGYVTVDSKPGKGTTFKIYLPLVKSITEETKSISQTTAPLCGTETILIAEDDTDVRTVTKIILEEAGYTVIEARDGCDALHKFMENKDKIKLLILDVIMPVKNGKEIYDEIRRTNSDIRALFMSGYAESVIPKQTFLEKGLCFLSKPFTESEILKKVRDVLDT